MPDYLWKYFDSDNTTIFVKLIPSVKALIEPLIHQVPTSGPTTWNSQPLGETFEYRVGHKSKYKEDMDMYFKKHIIYRDARKESEYYHVIQTKLQDIILAMVAKQKAAKFWANLPIRTWLKDVKALSALPVATIKRSISVEYYRLMNIRLTK